MRRFRKAQRFGIRHAALLALAGLAWCVPVRADEFIVSTGADLSGQPIPGPLLVLPAPSANFDDPVVEVLGAPSGSGSFAPHGLALLDDGRLLVTRIGSADLQVVTPEPFGVVAMQPTGPNGSYNGLGALTLAPGQAFLLALRDNDQLLVMAAPFAAATTAAAVALPGIGGSAQTAAIAFDPFNERAYVGHSAGISVLDPPYSSIAFTVPLPLPAGLAGIGTALAINADGTRLAATRGGNQLALFDAPLSPGSTPALHTIPGAAALDGMAFTPDTAQLLVADAQYAPGSGDLRVFALAAPFETAATPETLVVAPARYAPGFEDIAISADGQVALVTGGALTGEDFYLLHAPFTAADMQVRAVHVPPLDATYPAQTRGAGTVRLRPGGSSLLPQLHAMPASTVEGDAGTHTLRFSVRLSRASALPVSVDYATASTTPASATPDVDFVPASGTLAFAPGEREAVAQVQVVGDTAAEGQERFLLRLSNPVNASLRVASEGVGEIVNDDANALHIVNDSPLPVATFGIPYGVNFAAAGGTPPYSFWSLAAGYPPIDGMAMDAVSGLLSGTPAQFGEIEFGVQVRDATATFVTRVYRLRIDAPDARLFGDGFEQGFRHAFLGGKKAWAQRQSPLATKAAHQ